MEVDNYSDMSLPVHQCTRHQVPYDLTGHEQLPLLKSFMLHKLCWQRSDPTRDKLVLTLSGYPSQENVWNLYELKTSVHSMLSFQNKVLRILISK
jgi:hypothetical protein